MSDLRESQVIDRLGERLDYLERRVADLWMAEHLKPLPPASAAPQFACLRLLRGGNEPAANSVVVPALRLLKGGFSVGS